jgi:prolyl-tRNA synthetase
MKLDVCTAYETIFDRLSLKYRKAAASVGAMGGKRSHEYHIESKIGEDKIFTCPSCGQSASQDLAQNKDQSFIENKELCEIIKCGCKPTAAKIEHSKCIEIGHTFILGDRYTKVFPVELPNDKNSKIAMGCYGIGVSRLMQACIESLNVEGRFPNFPFEIAPFTLGILPARAGSKEEARSKELVPYLCNMLDTKENYNFHNNILVDDRTKLTIGSRLVDMKLAGVPFVIVLGKTVHDERCEIVFTSELVKTLLKNDRVECHSRETAVVLKQLVNDYWYAKKSQKLASYFKS